MKRNSLIIFLWLFVYAINAQSPFDSFHYQGYLKETSGLYNTSANAQFSLFKGANQDELLYSETQQINIDERGYFSANIGLGTPNELGKYNSISSINWNETDMYYLDIVINNIPIENVRIMSVPFAMISQRTLQKFKLNELLDVDTTGIKENDILKWNGTKWVPSPDLYYDTIPFADTSFLSLESYHSIYSDTAKVALQSKDAWSVFGNAGTTSSNFIGTTDNTALHFVTNNTKRLTITNTGQFGFGTETPSSDIHVIGNNGFLFESNSTGLIPIEGEGTRIMWYPGKYAFRGGTLEAADATLWNNNNIGLYSFAFGKNLRARGDYSVAFGEETDALGQYSMAVGYQSSTSAAAPYSFAAGYTSRTTAPYAVAMGRGNRAQGEASSAFNYHTTARGRYSQSFGFYSQANGDNSTAIGNIAVANHEGSFVFSDKSTNTATYSTAPNQFLARVVGGVVFYTSADLSTGAVLPPGSGSWSILSDSSTKIGLKLVDEQDILNKISKIKVYEWSYKSEKGVRHIGPMSQSFYREFGLGSDSRYISAVDIDGINFTAAKALYNKSVLIEYKINDYEILLLKYKKLEEEKKQLELRLEKLEKKINSGGL